MKRTLLTSEAILAFLLMSCSQGSGEEKTDLLFEESPSSYAEDPYGPLRPLFQKALIEDSSPENDLYSYYRAADIFPGLFALMGEE